MINILKRLISFLFLAMFILGTVVQFNDPDPEVWVPYWTAASLLPLMALIGVSTTRGPFSFLDKLARVGVIFVSLYWIVLYFPGVVQDYKEKKGDLVSMVIQKGGDIRMKDAAMEQAREFGGVVIILFYTLFIYPFSFPGVAKGKTN